jgi:hypothetical protein
VAGVGSGSKSSSSRWLNHLCFCNGWTLLLPLLLLRGDSAPPLLLLPGR